MSSNKNSLRKLNLILVRHGESTANVDSSLYDLHCDSVINLTHKGVLQSLEAADKLNAWQDETGIVITDIWCSPLLRAIQTAQIISHKLGGLNLTTRGTEFLEICTNAANHDESLAALSDPDYRAKLGVVTDVLAGVVTHLLPNSFREMVNGLRNVLVSHEDFLTALDKSEALLIVAHDYVLRALIAAIDETITVEEAHSYLKFENGVPYWLRGEYNVDNPKENTVTMSRLTLSTDERAKDEIRQA